MNKPQPRREHMLDVASTLFNSHGYHNTGIDTIMKESGVSKTTMYKYFRSKDELVLEVLKRRDKVVNEMIDTFIEASKHEHPKLLPHQHIDAIFSAIKNWVCSKEFTGCNFINASAEYADKDNVINQYSAYHKRGIQQKIESLLSNFPKKKAETLAKKIALVLDGAIVTTQVQADKTAIDTAHTIAKTLLNLET